MRSLTLVILALAFSSQNVYSLPDSCDSYSLAEIDGKLLLNGTEATTNAVRFICESITLLSDDIEGDLTRVRNGKTQP
jgi:hypothetical protein